MSSSRSDKWLLVQWGCGSRDVININSVISSKNEAKVGNVVIADRGNGSHEAAKVIAASRDRDLLDHHVSPKLEAVEVYEYAVAGPSHNDESKDFSESASSWAPSDDYNASTDDEEEVENKRIKLDKYNHSYSYTNRTSSKILKPCHRADAINLIIAKNRKRTKDKKLKEKASNVPNKKSVPDSTKKNTTPASKSQSDIISVQIQEIKEMTNYFHKLFGLLGDFKQQYVQSERQILKNIVNTPKQPTVKPEINNTLYEDNADDKSEVSNRSEDFNRSDDNILITNKYANANNNHLAVKENKQNEKPKERLKYTNTNYNIPAVKDNNQNEKPSEWIPIGSGKTLIHKDQYRTVNWKSFTIATRTLLLAVFPRRVLATHSLTGKRSPAFQDKPAKMCLDPKIVSDVIIEITDRFKVKENLVRSIITTKCADECKMLKMRQEKRKTLPANQDNMDDDYDANQTI